MERFFRSLKTEWVPTVGYESVSGDAHDLAGSRYIAEFFCNIEKASFVFDDWVASMKHKSYLLLSLITDLAPLIKVGNSQLFKLKCQI